MTTDDNIVFLGRVGFFKGCTSRELTDIAHLAEERVFEDGAVLCRQGDFGTEVFVVVEGEAEATIDGRRVGTVRPGEVVGELAMLGSGRRTATLRAAGPLRVLVLDPREVDSVLAADPSSASRLGHHDNSE
jgi:CRP-like cAMP-binding protein